MREKVINLDSRKQEIMKNIPGFPISCYYSRFSQDTYDYIDWHWHVEFQLCLTVSGSVLWHTEAEQTEVPAGQGIFINSQRVHMVRPVRKEASFFCLDIPPDFICPTRDGGLYEHSVLPVLQASALHRKLITPQTEKGREILRLLNEMAAVFDEKAMNLYWQGMYFRYGSLCESFLRKRLAVPKVLQTNGFGTYFCICRKIMVQPCAWMKWQRTSGSAEASAAAILRNMPGKPFLPICSSIAFTRACIC